MNEMIDYWKMQIGSRTELKMSSDDMFRNWLYHYGDVLKGTIASQITSLTIVYSTVYSDADQRKHQSSASLAFVWEIHREPMSSPHKWPVTRKMFPFDDVNMSKQSNWKQKRKFRQHNAILVSMPSVCWKCAKQWFISKLKLTAEL